MADKPSLTDLGYKWVPGPSSSPNDFELRQIADETQKFAWKGQENFVQLAEAVFLENRKRLVSLCGLEERKEFAPGTVYATPGLASRKAPALVLLCGDVPGGDAGTWSRRLCINDSTLSGAMFEYVTRAQALGWSLVIPDLHGAGDGKEPVAPDGQVSGIACADHGAVLTDDALRLGAHAAGAVGAAALADDHRLEVGLDPLVAVGS